MPPSVAASVVNAPLTRAQEQAVLADELTNIGDLDRALEEHRKASANYLESVKYTSEPTVEATLRRMHMEQAKAADELERRLAQMERESQLHQRPRQTYGYFSPTERSPTRTPFQSPKSSMRRLQDSAMSDKTSASTESFQFLDHMNDPGGRFDRIWGAIEAQMNQMTLPEAIAAFSVGEDVGMTDIDDGFPPLKHRRAPSTAKSMSKSKTKTKGKGDAHDEPRVVDIDFELEDGFTSDSDSWNLIPSSKPASRQNTATVGSTSNESRLKAENEELRAEMDKMSARMRKAENMLNARVGQEEKLKESIMMAKREAHRNLMQSTTLRHTTGINPLYSTSSPNPDPFSVVLPQLPGQFPTQAPQPSAQSDAQSLQKQIKALGDEVQRLKAENAKLTKANMKYEQKFAKAQEASREKRRKEATARAQATIKEEREEEEGTSGAGTGDDGPGAKAHGFGVRSIPGGMPMAI